MDPRPRDGARVDRRATRQEGRLHGFGGAGVLAIAAAAFAVGLRSPCAGRECRRPSLVLAAGRVDTGRGHGRWTGDDLARGTRLVYVARGSDGKQLLWVHPLDSLPRALPGTDGAAYPFWSPDGRFIGFFAEGRLKRIEATGGPPQILCDAATRGGTWSRAGVIVFSADAGTSCIECLTGGPGDPVPPTERTRSVRGLISPGRPSFRLFRATASAGNLCGFARIRPRDSVGKRVVHGRGLHTARLPAALKGGSMAGTLLAQPRR